MGHVDVAGVRYELPDGRVLLDDVSFRVGEGAKVALVGANGAGKTTLLRIITGDLVPHAGAVTRTGGLGVMRQMVAPASATTRPSPTCCSSVSPPRVRAAAAEVDRCELALMETDDEKTQMRYAAALAEYADAGGYDIEVTWDVCTSPGSASPSTGPSTASCARSPAASRSGWCWSTCSRGPDEVLLLDEPDNFLDVPGKIWLEQRIRESDKTILFISHDRELLDNTATRDGHGRARRRGQHGVDAPRRLRVVPPGPRATASPASRSCAGAGTRSTPSSRRWCCVQDQGGVQRRHGLAVPAAQTRLRKFVEAGPPTEQPREQQVTMRLKGGRTGKRAVVCERPGADRADEALRPRGLVRRAGRRPRLQRLRQVALPAPAGRRRHRPRRRAPTGGRGPGGRCDHTGGAKLGARVRPAGSCRPTSTPS